MHRRALGLCAAGWNVTEFIENPAAISPVARFVVR